MNYSRKNNRKSHLSWLYVLALLGLLLFGVEGYGQSRVALGGWQVHVPYQQAKAVADAGDKVYVAAENGLFYYDKEYNTTETITKVDGLREQQISTIGYDAATGTLVVAYSNTQVDLLRDNTIYNISDIFRKAIAGEKKIHHIFVHNKLAYLSGTFGVVVVDLQKREIKDTYSNLGPGGEAVSVRSSTILRDSIYLATNLELLAARHTGTNLQDFHNWSVPSNGLPAPDAPTYLAAFNNRLYAATSANGLFSLNGSSWHSTGIALGTAINSLSASKDYLSVATAAGVYLLDQKNNLTHLEHQLLVHPQQAVVGADGVVWVADKTNGLVRLSTNGSTGAAFAPDGPYSGSSTRVYTQGGKVYVLSGGYNENYLEAGNRDGFCVYESGEWKSYNEFLYPSQRDYTPARDLVSASYNPVTEKMYFGSYGSGLLEWQGPGKMQLYNSSNSTLISSSPDEIDKIFITDTDVDAAGNVWVVNRHQFSNMPGLHVLQPDASWRAFIVPGVVGGSLELIQVDNYGQKWLSFLRRGGTGSGLIVFDETQNRVRQLRTGEGNGGLPDGAVYSMAKDLNGDIWVGTASGVGVFYSPGIVFETQFYDAHIPVIDRRPLLSGQMVRAIAVDGANRKWMGTDNGLWLLNPDGDAVIHHFTTKNSPLPSDKVLSVAVEHKTGEVFVATGAGVASYRAGATITEGAPECAVVFPNPVRRDYTGLVGVSGLPNNASVRITDISGTLVYKTKALGGTLNWDARDYNGKRVKAGVYLVMSSGEEGGQTCISKIAVLE